MINISLYAIRRDKTLRSHFEIMVTVMEPTRNGRKHDGYKEKMRHSFDLSGSCASLRYIADLAGEQKHYASEATNNAFI